MTNTSTSQKPGSSWNSLEVAKLMATLTTPIIIGMFGFSFESQFKLAEERRIRESAVGELEEIIFDYEDHLSKAYYKISSPNDSNDSSEFPKDILVLESAEKLYQRKIVKVKYRIFRDVFLNKNKKIENFWDPSLKSFAISYRCIMRALQSAKLGIEKSPKEVMWDCFLEGETLAEFKLVGPVSNIHICAQNLIAAASLASLEPHLSFENLHAKVRSSVENHSECPGWADIDTAPAESHQR